jgi:hypothetical protein
LITYCTNIHPGESWEQIFANLQQYIPQVKAKISPEKSFPVGLRLSNRGAVEIDQEASERLLDWCQEQDCFISTINAFPYAQFHGAVVKDGVYLPDWRSQQRVDFTQNVGRLLNLWLPAGLTGAISTVPVGFKGHLSTLELPVVRKNLLSVLEYYAQLSQDSGRKICLALEPEPGCWLETTEEVCRFFDWLKLPKSLTDYLGICLDCCHQAVEFEDPREIVQQLAAAAIPIAKVQISSALRFINPQPQQFEPYRDDCYLHQVVCKDSGGQLHPYVDLPEAITAVESRPGAEWRVHYHVPIFLEETDGFKTTRAFIARLLPQLSGAELLEIETYTWDVLPSSLRLPTVVDSLVREIQWLQELQDEANRCS